MKIVNTYGVDGVCEAFGLTKKNYKSVELFRLIPEGTLVTIQYNKDTGSRLTDLTTEYGTIIVLRAGNNYGGAMFFDTYTDVHRAMGFSSAGDRDWYRL